jgi:glutamine amidotransferase
MCRLFALRAARAVTATFWLLDAPDSLAAQSHRNPDGAGIGIFAADGTPIIDKQPMAAWEDSDFAAEARELTTDTFVAHVRYASTGALSVPNTHPFTQDGRIFAHNGAFAGLDVLDRRLAELDATSLVGGETDSERMFALITAETRARAGDVEAGIVAALTWIIEQLPIYALNVILATPEQMWAMRYPETNELWLLQRPAAGDDLAARSARINARSGELGECDSVVVASEPMDDDPGWRPIAAGELLCIGSDLAVRTSRPFPATAPHLLSRDEL